MGKVVNLEELRGEIKKIIGRKVLLGGSFDILHAGHIKFIEKAKKFGDILIILLESDEKVKKLKGENRPINSQVDRAALLSGFSAVNLVILLKGLPSDGEYLSLVKLIRPDIIAVTNDDPIIETKKKQARQVGGRVQEVIKVDRKYSTSKIIKKARQKT